MWFPAKNKTNPEKTRKNQEKRLLISLKKKTFQKRLLIS